MLHPIKAEVYLIYKCPHCDCEWSKTPKEVIKLKGMVCDGCGQYTQFHPISNVSVKLLTNNKVQQKKVKLTDIQNDAILALIKLGFPKKEAKIFVSEHRFQTIEDYIQGAVTKGLQD